MRLERFYQGVLEYDDARLQEMLTKVYLKLCKMEQTKYSAPRFTDAMKDLAKYIGCYKSKEQTTKHADLYYLSHDNETNSDSEGTNFTGYSHFT
jgi:hypothetical protein